VDAGTELASFAGSLPFRLDPFQLEACRQLESGHAVLVCAPTGAGKTVVGEFAVHLALARGGKCFYTTPIKALSNQKFTELARRHGAANVGLLTGDSSVNGNAPIVVMTTEVLRNMLYATSTALSGLMFVVMDEVHYLADRFRGAVWEEVILHLPQEVALVSLSATVSNAEEFAEWLETVRGRTSTIISEERPVPLFQHVMAGSHMHDLFVGSGADPREATVNPRLVELAREETRFAPAERGRRHGPRPPRDARTRTPGRSELVERLQADALLPGIVFIFSRNGCDQAVAQCVRAGLRLISDEERTEVRRVVDERTSHLPEADLRVLGFWEWREALERGISAHHAGLLPIFKEVVEELFAAGLVRVVFATETLALGVNMPARSVTLTSLTKWNGETHADVTPGEYTQLTGRAGRRGIDVEGHGIVLWQPGFDPVQAASLASTRTYPLRSSFRPSYNMAVNLVNQVGRQRARELLEQSFAQFQTDKAVVGLAHQVERNERQLSRARDEAGRSELVEGYDALRRAIRERESALSRQGAEHRRAAAVGVLEGLRPGDVLAVPSGRSAGMAVVLEPGLGSVAAHAAARGAVPEAPRPLVLTGHQVKRLSMVDFPTAPKVLGRVRIPRSFDARNAQSRRDLAATLRNAGLQHDTERPGRSRALAADDAELSRLRTALRVHPVHGWEDRDQLLRQAERHSQLERDTARLRQRVEGRTGSLGRTFDRICLVLQSLGYLSAGADEVTDSGRRLARIYAETDLVVAECLARGVWEGLDHAGLAACLSSLVYESRRDDQTSPAPPPAVREALAQTVRVWGSLRELEIEQHLEALREPDPGFAWAAHTWARGASLSVVLEGAELTAGDFVRQVRQLIDLADQLAGSAGEGSTVQAVARRTVTSLRRGVVAPGVA
jgi:ATP-dependent RNA helicase HelY